MKKIIIDGIIGLDIYDSMIRNQLEAANGDEITVEISSPGGFVFQGLSIFNLIRDYSRNTNKVTTKLTGLAASMASYIALAGNKVTAEDNAIFMIHNVQMLVGGDYRDMQKAADTSERLTDLLANAYVAKCGQSKKAVRKMMDDSTFFFGKDAKQAGFVDEIIKSEKTVNENQDDLITMAKARIQSCIESMKDSEKAKSDIGKAAALLQINNFSNNLEPEDKINPYSPSAKLIDESWDKDSSETRWRDHAGVKSSDDLPNSTYSKRFVYVGDQKSLDGHKFPIYDFKNGEFVNISAVRNGLARLSNSDIPAGEKAQAETVLQKYLNRFNENKKAQEEKNIMTLSEFKAQNLDLYNEIYNLGSKSNEEKIKNIKAHLAFKKIAPDLVFENIEKDVAFDIVVQAEYGKMQMQQVLKENREKDNPAEITAAGSATKTGETAEDTEAAVKKFSAMYGGKK